MYGHYCSLNGGVVYEKYGPLNDSIKTRIILLYLFKKHNKLYTNSHIQYLKQQV